MAWCLNFPWVGYLPPIIWNCVLTRKKSNDKYYMCLAFGLNYPGIYANVVGYSLTHIDGVVRFGSLYEYVASFGIFNGADVGKTIDNGLYLLIIYFSWFAVFLSLWYMGKVIKMMINAFGDNRNFRVQLYLFTPVSLFFTGSIFSPEYAFLIVCPFILRKALNITR